MAEFEIGVVEGEFNSSVLVGKVGDGAIDALGLPGLNGSRITSYNVCYTKLLRVFTERDSYTRQLNEWKTNCDLLKKAGEVDDLPARPEPPSSLKKADALDENLNEGSRITSYNVCYTKLLRSTP